MISSSKVVECVCCGHMAFAEEIFDGTNNRQVCDGCDSMEFDLFRWVWYPDGCLVVWADEWQ